MRICPKCGKKFPNDRMRCNAWPKHHTLTVELIDWTDEDEAKAIQDLEDGILEDPFEDYELGSKPKSKHDYPKPEVKPQAKPEPNLREDLGGQADQIHDLLEEHGPMTYKELAEKLDVSPKRASNIVSVMIRDGVELKREGKPRKVSIA